MIRRKKIQHPIEPRLFLLKEKLQEQPRLLFGYLFGSYGKGKPGPLSDVDIAVFLDKTVGEQDFFEEKLNLVGIANEVLGTDEVDLVILNEAPLSLQFQVLKTGKLLFSKDEKARIDFETKTIDYYLDAEPLRRRGWEAMMKRIKEGKFGYGRDI